MVRFVGVSFVPPELDCPELDWPDVLPLVPPELEPELLGQSASMPPLWSFASSVHDAASRHVACASVTPLVHVSEQPCVPWSDGAPHSVTIFAVQRELHAAVSSFGEVVPLEPLPLLPLPDELDVVASESDEQAPLAPAIPARTMVAATAEPRRAIMWKAYLRTRPERDKNRRS